MKKQQTSHQLLKNYILLLFILPVLSLLVTVGLSQMDTYFDKYSRITAKHLMADDYMTIDPYLVEQEGGGFQVFDSQYRILRSVGLNPFEADQYAPQEFVRLLMDSSNGPNVTSFAYNEKEQFWLVVSLPDRYTFMNMQIHLNLPGVFLFVVMSLVLTLLSTFIYAKVTAVRFVRPLRQLSQAVKKLLGGDYSARVPVGNNREFSELESSFNHMAGQIEQQLAMIEQSERNRKSLVMDISHDLKNPLTSMVGYAELLMKEQEAAGSNQRNFSRIIYENSLRANELIMDLFEISRLDSPDSRLERKADDLAEFIRSEMIRMLPELAAAGLATEFIIPEERVEVVFDKKAMRRVLSNLLYNSIAYHRPGSHLRVSLELRQGTVRLTVANDSAGYPSAEGEKLLELFVRDGQTEALNPYGTGVGLAIVKKIISAHGGSVLVNTEQQGIFEIIIDLPQQM